MATNATMNPNSGKKFVSQQYFNLGFYLVTPLLLGVGVGIWLDRIFGSSPVFVLGGIFIGVSTIFYIFYKMVKSSEEDEEKK